MVNVMVFRGELLPTPGSAVNSDLDREAILVLGMHRTGTSALSGVVHMLGAGAPANLQPGDEFNPNGYWESQAVVRLNDRILQAAGGNWKDWTAFDGDRLASGIESEFEAELGEVITAEFGDARLIALKDPRICRLASFWLHGLDRAGIVPKIVIPIRNPLETALSLLDRDNMPVHEGLLLWLRHVLDAERLTRGRVRCFVSFTDLLDDWRGAAERISRALKIEWPRSPSAASSEIDRFLSRDLRHQERSYQDLKVRSDVSDWVLAAYDAVMTLSAAGEPPKRSLDRLDEIYREFEQASRVFGAVVLQKTAQIEEHARRATELDGRLKAAEQELADARAASSRMQEETREAVDRLQRHADAARDQIAALAGRIGTTEAALAQRTEQAEAYRADLAAARATLSEREAALARGTEEAEAYRTDLEAARTRLSAREAEFSARTLEAEATAEELQSYRRQATLEMVRARIALHNALRANRAGDSIASRLLARLRRQAVTNRQRREAERAELIRASGLFDSAWYLRRYQDVREAGIDPAIHYLRHGATEGRDPSPQFSTAAYRQRYLDVATAGVNPLVHFLEFGISEERQFDPVSTAVPSGRAGVPSAVGPEMRAIADGGLTSEHLKFSRRGDGYEDFDPTILNGVKPDVKVLAFYLPQYHAIPENDAFWGKGFTEWRQTARGLPRFPGHYQPRISSDLGFYDLTDRSVMRRQVEMARAAGIHGFGFYYYWFDGRRILDGPVESFLASPDIDMPFMAIWANENWTRTWDGMNGEILLRQSYDPKDEAALLADLARHFADPRYIRLAGRPFFVIYQPRHVPDARQTFARWRAHWQSEFGLEPVIFMAQTFGVEDPREFGLDGAIEFPPHKLTNLFPGREVPDAFSPGFAGRVIGYEDIAATSLNEAEPAYPLIKTIVPGWDNDARRPLRGTIIEGSTPRKYQDWLSELARRARAKPVLGESIVAVNAWNEWAEAAYLEPDVHFGAAYLNATARALLPRVRAVARGSNLGVVLVGHDALDFGAQRILLNIGRTLTRGFGLRIQYVLLGTGPLRSQYEAVAPCAFVSPDSPDQMNGVFTALAAQRFSLGIVNTTVSGKVVEHMKAAGFQVASLVHELPGLIRSYNLEEHAQTIGRSSDVVVFPDKLVRHSFGNLIGGFAGRVAVKPQGLYRTEIAPDRAARARVRAELGLPAGATIVLNVGYGDLRKGFDLFTRTAKELAGRRRDVFFVWVGKLAQAEPATGGETGGAARDNRRVIAVGHKENVADYYAAADLLFLSSREDPYPSVVLEAMAAGLPVVGFAGATGCEDLIAVHGALAPAGDIAEAAAAIAGVLDTPADLREAAAAARIAEIRANYDFKDYCFWLAQQLDPSLRRISVLVPNYNHERYLQERLVCIFGQSYPVYEIIVLDDGSRDGSLAAIRDAAARSGRDIQLVANESNSGSIARQWRSGLERCGGDFVWIAESDDVASPEFLADTVRLLEQSGADFCFTDSWQIDGEGNRVGGSYIPYVDDIAPGTFRADFAMPGRDFLRDFLGVKNVILNMSGVLWRREALSAALVSAGPEIEEFRLAGDWRLSAEACRLGQKVAYLAKALNGHRRHDRGVTSSLDKQRHVDEVVRMQISIAQATGLDERTLGKAEQHLADIHHRLDLPMRNDLMSIRDVGMCEESGGKLGVVPAVHPGDFIFRWLLSHPNFAGRSSAIEYYFQDGRKSAETLRGVLQQLGYDDGQPATLLEFASGYGKVTRHAKHVFPDTDWTACDIHRDATVFIARELTVKSVLSANLPEDLSIGTKFDVVFALSFFSHMPERTWSRWLKALYGLVREGGYLIFTTHGLASARYFGNPEIPASGIWFKPESEQKDLDVSEYGQTIVTSEFVTRTVRNELKKDIVLEKLGFWWGHQDLYVTGGQK